jgi:hypothetical protein
MDRGPRGPGDLGGASAEVLWSDEGLVVASLGRVCIAVWRATVTRTRFEAQRVGLEQVVRGHAGGVGFLCVVEATSPIPDDDMRRASANMIAIHRPRLEYVACVIEGESLKIVAVRAVLTTMRHLVTGKVANGYFATVAEAARGLGEHLPIGPEMAFVEAIERVRRTPASGLDDQRG